MQSAPASSMLRIGTRLVLVFTIVATFGCDRVTKHVASTTLAGAPVRSFLADTVRFGYVENAGGFLGLGADLPETVRTAVFTVGTALLLLVLVGSAFRLRWTGWPAFAMTLLVAGGVSNLFDRAVHGSVIDFINVGVGPVRTGIFNVADMAIMLGIGILLAAEFRRAARPPEPDEPSYPPT
jgi:signal peptidase II